MQQMSLFETTDPNCLRCDSRKNSKTPQMKYYGEGKKEVLIIGECPTKTDDDYGIPFIGTSGQYLNHFFKKYGFNIDQDAWRMNAVSCRVKDNNPTKDQIECCFPYLKSVIQELKPKFIWTFGTTGLQAIQESCFGGVVMAEWAGLQIYDHTWKSYVLPMMNPAIVLRDEKNLNQKIMYNKDLYNAILALQKPPKERLKYKITQLLNFEEIINILKRTISEEIVYFDYETTGLKPFAPGHKIASISFTCDGKQAFAFPFEYRKHFEKHQIDLIRRMWVNILNNNNILKAAQNFKYEDNWSRYLLRSNEINWYWDTMLTSHILDCRRKFSGLKRQAYITFGERPYDDHIQPFLKADNSHALNNVMKIPLKELLKYNGLDNIYGFNLMEVQEAKLANDPNLKRANNLFRDGAMALSDVQLNGICVDEQFYVDKDKEIQLMIKKLDDDLRKSKEAVLFEKTMGKPLDFGSSKDMGELLYDILKLEPTFTEKGNRKVSKDVVASFDIPFVHLLLEKRKWEKVNGTYIAQMSREICNEKISPFFDLHIPVSYRSCIAKGALIFTKNGQIPIEEIKKGDSVYCFDNELNKVEREVLWSGCTGHKKVVKIIIEDENGEEMEIETTLDHPIRLSNGDYVLAKNLKQGDSLLC